MSKQDTHFFNVFSLVIGLLVAVAVGLFALARIVASHTQNLQVLTEADYSKNVDARIPPLAQVAIAGRDNSALAIKPAEGAAAGGALAAMPKNGTELFDQTCSACHGQGIGGAPRAGDKAAWGPRIKEGLNGLLATAIKGEKAMPPRGGAADLSDYELSRAIVYMANQSGGSLKEPAEPKPAAAKAK